MIGVPRKKTGRPPGRPRAGEKQPANDTETRTLYIDVLGKLWNKVDEAVERERSITGFRSASKSDVLANILERALLLHEKGELPELPKK